MTSAIRAFRSARSYLRDIEYKIWRWLAPAPMGNRGHPSLRVDVRDAAAAHLEQFHDASEWLRGRLRRTPYWRAGHLQLAELCLEADDVGCAYASAHAALLLEPPFPERRRAKMVLGRCYLQRGVPDRARVIFEELVGTDPADYSAKENLAACLMSEQDLEGAERLLLEIPADGLTAEGASVLSYLKGKRSGEGR